MGRRGELASCSKSGFLPACLPHPLCSARSEGGPWMELCLKAYYTDPSRPWQTRRYRVCDTSLQQLEPPPPAEQRQQQPQQVRHGGDNAA